MSGSLGLTTFATLNILQAPTVSPARWRISAPLLKWWNARSLLPKSRYASPTFARSSPFSGCADNSSRRISIACAYLPRRRSSSAFSYSAEFFTSLPAHDQLVLLEVCQHLERCVRPYLDRADDSGDGALERSRLLDRGTAGPFHHHAMLARGELVIVGGSRSRDHVTIDADPARAGVRAERDLACGIRFFPLLRLCDRFLVDRFLIDRRFIDRLLD